MKETIPIGIPQVLVSPAQTMTTMTGLRPEPGLSFLAAAPAGRPAGFWRPLPDGKRHATHRASATREGPVALLGGKIKSLGRKEMSHHSPQLGGRPGESGEATGTRDNGGK